LKKKFLEKSLLIERSYPYFIAIVFVIICIVKQINFVESENLKDALESINTIYSLILGFLGAILPVILGMKNESKLVRYLFEKDENKLFLKYLKANIFWGLIGLFVSVALYFNDVKMMNRAKDGLFYALEFLFVLFCVLTYRCLKNMLDLIFSDDNHLGIEMPEQHRSTEDEKKIQRQFMDEEPQDPS